VLVSLWVRGVEMLVNNQPLITKKSHTEKARRVNFVTVFALHSTTATKPQFPSTRAPETTMAPIDEITQKNINAPEHQLRALLKVQCTSHSETRDRVWDCLSVFISFDTEPLVKATKRKANDVPDSISESDAKRAKLELINDIHHCVRCNQSFLESENNKEACWYHPGEFCSEDSLEFHTITAFGVVSSSAVPSTN